MAEPQMTPEMARKWLTIQLLAAGWEVEEITPALSKLGDKEVMEEVAALDAEAPPNYMWDRQDERALLRKLLGEPRRFESSAMLDIEPRLCAQVVGELMLTHMRQWENIDLTPAVSLASIRMLKQIFDILVDPEIQPEDKPLEILGVYDAAGIL